MRAIPSYFFLSSSRHGSLLMDEKIKRTAAPRQPSPSPGAGRPAAHRLGQSLTNCSHCRHRMLHGKSGRRPSGRAWRPQRPAAELAREKSRPAPGLSTAKTRHSLRRYFLLGSVSQHGSRRPLQATTPIIPLTHQIPPSDGARAARAASSWRHDENSRPDGLQY